MRSRRRRRRRRRKELEELEELDELEEGAGEGSWRRVLEKETGGVDELAKLKKELEELE